MKVSVVIDNIENIYLVKPIFQKKRLMEFVNKLGIGSRDFYYSLYDKDRYDFEEIKTLYLKLEAKNYDGFDEKLKALSKLEGLNSYNQRFLIFIQTEYSLGKKKFLKPRQLSSFLK